MRETHEPTRLIVRIEAGETAIQRLAIVLGAVPIASVIIAAAAGRPLTVATLSPLIAAGQKAGAAVLIQSEPLLVRSSGADGVHLFPNDTSAETYAAARAVLGPRTIVGADAGRSRHDAMTLGETGADYVAFGIPNAAKNRGDAFDHQLELIEWWAELFEVPCVALAGTDIEAAAELAAAGADFVCMDCASGLSLAELEADAKSWGVAIARAPRHVV